MYPTGRNHIGQVPEFPKLPDLPDPLYPSMPELDDLAIMAKDAVEIADLVHSQVSKYNFKSMSKDDLQTVINEIQNQLIPALEVTTRTVQNLLDLIVYAQGIMDVLQERTDLMYKFVRSLPPSTPEDFRSRAFDGAEGELNLWTKYAGHYESAIDAISLASKSNKAAVSLIAPVSDVAHLEAIVKLQEEQIEEARKRKVFEEVITDIKNVVLLGIGAIVLVNILQALR